MRSRKEVLFRLGQELGNLRMLLKPPEYSGDQSSPLPGLPAPESVASALRGTEYAATVVEVGDEILGHRFPLLGLTLDLGPAIAWRRDPFSGSETGLKYFRRIPYLDAKQAGDHKVIWELNRHQHWVLLAQASLLTGEPRYVEEVRRQFETWVEQNPFQRGMNWTSALEVGFRALSWIWVYHLVGAPMEAVWRRRLLTELYRHGRHIERNLSIYFSPNTHLLGEAVALHALGRLFPAFPEARRWQERGAGIMREQMARQVREDGSHFEQSTYYHLYALDMFLFHTVLERSPDTYLTKLARMAEYAADLMGPQRALPYLGDDDGGRFFHPYGPRERFGRATLATCGVVLNRPEWLADHADLHEQAAWWLGPDVLQRAATGRERTRFTSKLYPDSGIAVMAAGDAHVIVDAGPFGEGSAGHSHSDTLSVVARAGAAEILIDPGTYTYVGDPAMRDSFRGSAAHNTIRIDGCDQAAPAGPFRWRSRPEVRILEWLSAPPHDWLDASCSYAGFTHRRRVLFLKPDGLVILDDFDGPAGEHTIEQFWRPGVHLGHFAFTQPAELLEGWRSRAFGRREPAPVLRIVHRGALPVRLAAYVSLSGERETSIEILGPSVRFSGTVSGNIRYADVGMPNYSSLLRPRQNDTLNTSA